MRSNLVLIFPSTLLLAAILACGPLASLSSGGGISFEEAGQMVVEQVVEPGSSDRGLIVFGLDQPLQAGDVLAPYTKEGYPGPADPFEADEPTWFFWVDDAPGAMFVHPTRFVFVRQSDGQVTVQDQDWWPVLNGQGLWITEDEYWDPTNWIYSNLEGPAGGGESGGQGALLASISHPPPAQNSARNVGIVLNGWKPGERLEEMFEIDSNGIHDALDDSDFDVTYFGPAEDSNPDRDGTFEFDNWNPWFLEKSRELEAGDTLFVYLTGHGFEGRNGNGFAGPMGEDLLVNQLERFKPGVHIIVVVQACHSGAFVDGLRTVADVTVVSTNNLDPAYNDIDTGQFSSIEETDPNDDDTGSEFVSGFVEDWNEIRADASARQEAADRASREGTNEWQETTALSYPSAVEKDLTAQAGWSFPNLVRGDASTRPAPVTEVSLSDPTGDAISCTSGEPLGEATNPAADLTGASAALADDGQSVTFTMELGLVDDLQGRLFGGVEFFDTSRANSDPNPQWVFDGKGNLNLSFTADGQAFAPMLHNYQEGTGWTTVEEPGFVVEGDGNVITIDIPVELIPLDSPYYFSITDLSGCDSIGLDKEGQASLYLPFPVGPATSAPTATATPDMAQIQSQTFSDNAGDAVVCSGGEPIDDPAVDIQTFEFALPTGEAPWVEVFPGQSPLVNFQDYSYSLQVRVGQSGSYRVGIYEIHDEVTRIGELETVEQVAPGTGDQIIPGSDSVIFLFPEYFPQSGDTVTVQAFHMETPNSPRTCDASRAFDLTLTP